MRCGACGTDLIAGKAFCHACGVRVTVTCRQCGAVLEVGFRFCPDCGAAAAPEEAPAAAPAPAEDRFSRLSQHIPTSLAERIRASQGTIAGERKLVSVLFCDLVGSTAIASGLDPEVYRDLLDEYLEIAFRQIYRFDGIVNQLAGDGMMALFGAPLAHEDAPQRAVRAALAIRDAMHGFTADVAAARGVELRARIGINTGPVVVGTVGNDLKMDYTAIGDTTNLAARLESLATPEQVLISETTYRLVRGFFVVEPVGPLEVKGKRDPVPAYAVLGESEATTPMAVAQARGLTPFVGRTEELAQLRACYERLNGSLAQVVAVVGEAGSGKSRLLYEFRRELAGEPVTVFEARCSALTRSLPYAPFVRMLRQHFGIGAADEQACACDKLSHALREEVEDGERLYPALCRFLSVGDDRTEGAAVEELTHDQVDAVSQLVMALSDRCPVVMMIEDLQWIDDASREMLELAAGRMQRKPVMLLATFRPDYQPTWKVRTAYTQLHLRSLTAEPSAAVVRALAGPLPRALEARILHQAEGNPFFLEELTRALLEEGAVVPDGAQVHLARPVEEIRIPDTIHEVIAARLDRLGGDAKRVVQVAAVLGRQFNRAEIATLLGADGVDVAGALAELERRGVIHRKNLLSDDEYRFGESLTQEVAYEALLLKERRLLHDRIGCLLEARSDGASAERAALMAHHFSRSENHGKAYLAARQAADAAVALPSYPAAIAFFRQAWLTAEAALRDGGNGDDSWWMRALEAANSFCRLTVFYGSDQGPDCRQAARRVRELGERLGDNDAVAGGYTFEGLMTMNGTREEFPDGLALVERGLELARQATPLTAINITRGMSFAYLHDGRLELAQQLIDWVVHEIEASTFGPRSDLYLGARFNRETLRFYCDDLAGALRGARECYDLAVEVGNRTVQSISAGTIALASHHAGEYEEARRWADRGLEVAEQIGGVSSLRTCATVALAARVALGETAVAPRYLELIEQSFAAHGDMALKSAFVVEALLGIGDRERARRFAEEAYAHAGGALREAIGAVALGHVALSDGPGSLDDARHWYARALALAERIGSRSTIVAARIGAAQVLGARGDRDGSARLLRQAVALGREIGFGHYVRQAGRLLDNLEGGTGARAVG